MYFCFDISIIRQILLVGIHGCWSIFSCATVNIVNCNLHNCAKGGDNMKLQAGQVKEYGTFLNLTLAKKNSPGDGLNGHGVKKG